MARTLQERYDFLVKYLKVVSPDYWEGDAMLEMKPLYFNFPVNDPDVLKNIGDVIDLAIEAKEWDEEWAARFGNQVLK